MSVFREIPVLRERFNLNSYLFLLTAILFGCHSPYPIPEEVKKQLPNKVDFNYHIKPILSDRCFKCHGPDQNALEADLRLDLPEVALEKVLEDGGHAIVPHQIGKSVALERIYSTDEELIMPPPDSKLTLSNIEKALIQKWIEQGAEYKQHWSFISPKKPKIPKIKQKDWSQNDVDHFVLAKMEEKGFKPSEPANKAQLLRRLSFDLIGLPPSLEELDAFLADSSENALEKQVDRLLASPHYGERMASDWLDIARYADSHGYQDDGFRYVWPWRDWVVKAFNENIPYDRFIQLQLAGDLLPDASIEDRLATTFLRNHRMNSEAGIVGEEYRVEYVADRTNTLGTAFLGLTLECARCHDHKYDPISQKDYYSLFAYFNNVNELGEIANDGNAGPLMMLTDSAMEAEVEFLQRQIELTENRLNDIQAAEKPIPSEKEIQEALKKDLLVHYDFEGIAKEKMPNKAKGRKDGYVGGNPSLVPGKFGKALQLQEYQVVSSDRETMFDRTSSFSVSMWLSPVKQNAYVPIWGDPSNKNLDFKGFGMVLDSQRVMVRLIHALPHNHIQVRSLDTIPRNQWSHIVVRYNGSSRAKGVEVFVNGESLELEIMYDKLYKGFRRIPIRLGGMTPWGSLDKALIDEFRVYRRKLSQLEIKYLFDPSSEQFTDDDLSEFQILHHNDLYTKRFLCLDSLRQELHCITDTIREIMVMEEMPNNRPAYTLIRGIYDAHDSLVNPAVPAVFAYSKPDSNNNRLAMAKWLTDPAHPLTARVVVNRLWKQFFGVGLVRTLDDFGSQGALPSHPELLDLLAIELITSGWDIRHIIKQIVLSATYQQTSHASEELLEKDPENTFLARGPRFRLPAEMLRDQALAASALLVPKVGGPPVKPYQPPGLWKQLAVIRNSLSTYHQDHGDKLYRRSLYTIWKRTLPPPAMSAFDAPTREICQVERQQTSTPLQALVLWNDPQWLEASRILAERMIREGGESIEARIQLAFRLLISREAKGLELDRMKAFFKDQLDKYRASEAVADDLLCIGEYPIDETLDTAELAACTMVAHSIMNLDEAIVRY